MVTPPDVEAVRVLDVAISMANNLNKVAYDKITDSLNQIYKTGRGNMWLATAKHKPDKQNDVN